MEDTFKRAVSVMSKTGLIITVNNQLEDPGKKYIFLYFYI